MNQEENKIEEIKEVPINTDVEKIEEEPLNPIKFEREMNSYTGNSFLRKFLSKIANSATAIGWKFDTKALLSTAGAKLVSWLNNGTEKASIDKDGKITCVGLAAGSEKITGVKDPTEDQDAATKKYVDDNENTGLWEIDGNETQLKTADEIDMQSKKIINLTDPTANQDAATKKYVDDNVSPSPTASDDMLVASADTERSNTDVFNYAKVKEIKIGKTGTYRVKYEMKLAEALGHGEGLVYKNGSPIGVEDTTYVDVYNDYGDASLAFNAGDLIQLYTKVTEVDGYWSVCKVKNFRIYATNFDIANVIID